MLGFYKSKALTPYLLQLFTSYVTLHKSFDLMFGNKTCLALHSNKPMAMAIN